MSRLNTEAISGRTPLTRRHFLATTMLAASGSLLGRGIRPTHAGSPAPVAPGTAAGLTLADLPYPANALEPYIDRKTMEIHHGRHYQNRRGDYVDAWWNIVNWPHVDTLYRMAKG